MKRTISKVSKNEIYSIVKQWWIKRNFPIVAYALLPETAYVYSVGDEDVAIVFLYKTDSILLWSAYPTTNPDVSKEIREDSLTYLNDVIADDNPDMLIFTTTSNDRIEQSLINSGYTKGDENVKHYIKITNGNSNSGNWSRDGNLPNSLSQFAETKSAETN